MKIGLFGGSFNPPHKGHREISLIAMRRLGLDAVWWIVTPGNPLKSHDELAPLRDRIASCQAIKKHPLIKITAFEEARNSPYTYETLKYLRRRHNQTGFVWLMGADNLVNFHHWQRWQDIINLMSIAVIDRPGFRYPAMSSRFAIFNKNCQLNESKAALVTRLQPSGWVYISSKLYAISSTEIRNNNKNQ